MLQYGRHTVTIPGEEYVWEPDEIDLGEQLMLEREADSTYDQWIGGLRRDEAVPWQILIWFLRRKAGRQEDRFSVVFPIRKADIERLCWQVGCPERPLVETINAGTDDEPDMQTVVRQFCKQHGGETDPEASAGSEPATSSQPSSTTGSGPGSSIG